MHRSSPRVHAVVLAGQRASEAARPGALPLKALEPVDGVPMLERVVAALVGSGCVADVTVCAADPGILRATPALARLAETGALRFHSAARSPAASLGDFLAHGAAPPVLVTAADHALLTPAMVRHFVESGDATGADVAVALVESCLFRREFPDARRTFVPLAGGGVSGANLFLFRTEAAAAAARFWQRAESFRKRPWRMVSVFGPGALLRFALGRLDLDRALATASRAIGARVAAVRMPFAESAIDVDTPEDLALASRLLAARRQSEPSSTATKRPEAGSKPRAT